MLVLNRKMRRGSPQSRLEQITFNLSGAKAQERMLRGRRHLVVPAVMITEGVHRGNRGRGLYRARETASTVMAWNGMPIVVDHPDTTARDPEILDETEIGVVLNTNWSRSRRKLACEAWVDIERAKQIAPDVLLAINNGRKVEVSTGLFLRRHKRKGIFKGQRFDWIAKNQVPDHLAVLPDEEGACSIKRGCGLNTNRRGKSKKCQCGTTNRAFSADMRKQMAEKGTAMPDGSFPVATVADLKNAIQAIGRATDKAAAERHITKRAKALGATNLLPSDWKVTRNSGGPALTDPALTADELVLLSQHRKEPDPMLSTKRKARMVRQLIKNSGVWGLKDKKQLTELPDEVLKKVYRSAIEPEDADDGKSILLNKKRRLKVMTGSKKKKVVELPVKNKEGKADGEKKPKKANTAAEWLKSAPPEVQAVYNQSLKAMTNRKIKLVRTIVKNKANKFSKKWLMKQDIDMLEGMAVLATNTSKPQSKRQSDDEMFLEGFEPDYSGAVGASPVTNKKGDEDDPEGFLTTPDLFAKNTKKKKKAA